MIVLMDNFRLSASNSQYLHNIRLCDQDTGSIFYDRLGFIYIELVNFNKTEDKLENDLHKWLYVLKNMADLNQLPRYLNKPIFEKLFQIAEYSNLNKGEKQMYDVSLKRKWDEYSLLTSAESRGIQKG